MVHLAVRMYCNWPTDHAIDHSSVGLNRLTIQLVFNEVSLFTFSEETHGFDVTVLQFPYLVHNFQIRFCKCCLKIGEIVFRDARCGNGKTNTR